MTATRDIRRKVAARSTLPRAWNALTDPNQLTKWLVRRAKVNPGPDGVMELAWGGVRLPVKITLWHPERSLALVWTDGTIVRFDLQKRGAEVIVSLTALGFRNDDQGTEDWAAAREAWAFYLLNLKTFLERRKDLRETNRNRTEAQGWVNPWA